MTESNKKILLIEDLEPVRIDRVGLAGRIAELLRMKILDGIYEQGSYLPAEATLAEGHRVSRPVVREALRILSTQGLVEISQGRRTRVRHADSSASVEALSILFRRSRVSDSELIEVRKVLEVEIAGLAAERARRDDLKALEQAVKNLKTARNVEQVVEADVDFHLHLARATGNEVFVLLLKTLRNLLLGSVRKTASRCPRSVHDKILGAVKQGDAPKARQAMQNHILQTKQFLRESNDSRHSASVLNDKDPMEEY